MVYQIVHPIVMSIDGNSFKTAVKNFSKLNYDLNLNSIIITDQVKHMNANLRYFNDGSKKKVHISMSPTTWPLPNYSNGLISPLNQWGAPGLYINSDKEIISPLSQWPYSPEISYDTKEYPAETYLELPAFLPSTPIFQQSSLKFQPTGVSFLQNPILSYGPVSPLPPLFHGIAQ